MTQSMEEGDDDGDEELWREVNLPGKPPARNMEEVPLEVSWRSWII